MLHPSKRGELMPSSPIRKLAPFAEEATKRGLKVYHLNIGQPDLETPPMALQAVKDADIKTLGYSHSAGNESYRKKLVQYYHKSNIEVTQDQILVTTGGSEGLVFAMMACLDPGDEVIIPEPFYANYNGFAVMAGVNIVPISSYIENGFALPPIPEFEKLISPKTKGIMICNPNNPTGYLYSKEEMEQLEDICLRHNLYLFSDEAYREFCYDGEYTSALHLKKIPEHVVLIDTISKRYSACGARIGALITRNKKVYDSVMKFAQARLSPPGLAQILAEAALDLPSTYFDIPRAAYISRRNLLVKRLNEMPGVFCPTPGGAFYVMARLPIDDCDKFCQWLLESFSHNGQTLMLAPASGFYETQSLGKDQVRFAYVIKNEDIDAAMDCLEAALKIYPGRTN
jgi:aspartate aminotransferase